ncbi:MAG: oxidoreductase [Porticoccaceae bacterium]|nr:MAG: oxidoreductase [Porticoccaceae bacterium]
MDEQLLQRLAQILGPDGLLVGECLAERSGGYWDPRPLSAAALARPHTTAQVAAVLAACSAHRQPVVVQGGLTGAVSGQRARPGELVLSLERMDAIVELDPVERVAVVEAGCTLGRLQRAAAGWDLEFPVDIGARDSCTLGGNIATNAGGMEVLRHGMMRRHVLGLEVVLADGTVLDATSRLPKDNAGYDLKQLFIGSEGTLGVVTRAVLALIPRARDRATALVGLAGLDAALALLDRLERALGPLLVRFEAMDGPYYRHQTSRGHPAALPATFPWYALVETAGHDAERDRERLLACLEEALVEPGVGEIAVASNERERAALWRLRESFDATLVGAHCFLYDVSLPRRAIPSYVERLRAAVSGRWPQTVFFCLGHLADGNLHFFLAPQATGEVDALRAQADRLVYGPLSELGGSVSAEHGIGLDKKCWLAHSRKPAEIALMRLLKRTLDPAGILNPGRVLDA